MTNPVKSAFGFEMRQVHTAPSFKEALRTVQSILTTPFSNVSDVFASHSRIDTGSIWTMRGKVTV